MENLLSIFIGIGLSAASGFRIFIPFLVLGITSTMGFVDLDDDFKWISTAPAIIVFAALTIAEIIGYFNPWIDNMLDTVATPLSIISGTILSLSVITGFDPLIQWSIAIIIGGGIAADFQFLSVKARSVSSVFSGGNGNPVISGLELVFSVILSILSIYLPVITFVIVIILMISLFIILRNAKARLNEKF
ncbi:MAG: DUF4126 domain-containing protein [Ignavibacteria bacterium]